MKGKISQESHGSKKFVTIVEKGFYAKHDICCLDPF